MLPKIPKKLFSALKSGIGPVFGKPNILLNLPNRSGIFASASIFKMTNSLQISSNEKNTLRYFPLPFA